MMEYRDIYKFTREDGGVTVSIDKPEGEYVKMVRIVAGEGKMITKDGVNLCPMTDECSGEGWYEVDAPSDEAEEAEKESENDETV